MNLKTILLLGLIACVTMAASDTLEDPEFDEEYAGQGEVRQSIEENEETNHAYDLELPQLDPSDIQFQVIKRCNHRFKSIFTNKADSTSPRTDMRLYCKGIQAFIHCLEASNSRGPFIDNYRYVILQHGMIDKKLSVCPNHVYTKLKSKVRDVTLKHLFIDDIGGDRFADCAATVHKKCVKLFTKNMETNSNMCQDVQAFLTCYKKETPNCAAKITQHFNHLCSQLGEQMLKANENHKGMMC